MVFSPSFATTTEGCLLFIKYNEVRDQNQYAWSHSDPNEVPMVSGKVSRLGRPDPIYSSPVHVVRHDMKTARTGRRARRHV